MTDATQQVLVVEDEEKLAQVLKEYLQQAGYEAHCLYHGDEVMPWLENHNPDMIILDLMLPGKDGIEVCREYRKQAPVQAPILMLTARDTIDDKEAGFQTGADDYLVKPFSMKELYLRIRNQLKKSIKEQVQSNRTDKTIGQFIFRPERRELDFAGQLQSLTTIENRLLLYFLQSKDLTIDNEAAMRAVWDDHHSSRSRSLTVYVSKLRKYLSKDPNISILNVHGTGYRLSVVP